MVFYKILFKQREQITGSMAIIYSTLVGQSLMMYGELFDHEGTFDYDSAKEYICEATEDGKYYIDCVDINVTRLSKLTEMTKQNVRLTLHRLRKNHYISIEHESIYCPINLLDEGFIKIPNGTNLKGWQLIDYAFMKDRSRHYGGSIDTWASKLSESLNTTTDNVYKSIERLKKKGYVKRENNGHLLIK